MKAVVSSGWGVSGSAVHSSPLLTEYFASALISLEIHFTSVLLNVSFPLQKMQYHV